MASEEVKGFIEFGVSDVVNDPEMFAMAIILKALLPLDQPAQARVLKYLERRFSNE